MEVHGRNPWLVEDLDDFYFLCCPECTYKSKDDEAFIDHAVENHPKSKASNVFSEVEQKLSKQHSISKVEKVMKVIGPPENVQNLKKVVKIINFPKTVASIDLPKEKDVEKVVKVIGPPENVQNLKKVVKIIKEEVVEESQTVDFQRSHFEDPDDFESINDESIITEHEDITRQIVRCSECKKALPNDETAIKHHMINEHIKAKRQKIAIGGAPKNMKDEEIDEIEIKEELITTDYQPPRKLKMDFRSESTPTNPELINYRTIDPDIKRYACTYCGVRFHLRVDREAHEKENHVDKDGNLLEITCDLCQEKVASSIHYRRHCIDKHKKHNKTLVKMDEIFCCDECGKTYKKVGDLTQHKKLHVDKTKLDFKCDMCEYASYAKKYLNAHVIKVHRGKEHYKHICEHCGKKFLYPFDLKQHHCNEQEDPIGNPDKIENWKCEPCGKTFNKLRFYMMHFVRIHNTMPPCYEGRETFKCEIKECGSIFLNQYNLDFHTKNVHERKVTKRKRCFDKSYKLKPGGINCPQCNKPMSSDHKLKRHINTMHGEKKFFCPQCQKGFCTKGNLNMHINGTAGAGYRKFSCKDGTKLENHNLSPFMRRKLKKEKEYEENNVNPPTIRQKQSAVNAKKRKVELDKMAAKENETQAAVESINNYQ